MVRVNNLEILNPWVWGKELSLALDLEYMIEMIMSGWYYEDDIESNFFSTCAFLKKDSAGGIVYNTKKFQFAEEEVRFVGFMVTNEGLKPLPEFLDNIPSFPTPKSITDVRSWFGAINQVSYAFASSEAMLPFRQLLRPQVPFFWS